MFHVPLIVEEVVTELKVIAVFAKPVGTDLIATYRCLFGCAVGCDQRMGGCSKCGKGYYGSHCSHQCPENCKNKVWFSRNGSCIECTIGYVGPICEIKCNPTC